MESVSTRSTKSRLSASLYEYRNVRQAPHVMVAAVATMHECSTEQEKGMDPDPSRRFGAPRLLPDPPLNTPFRAPVPKSPQP